MEGWDQRKAKGEVCTHVTYGENINGASGMIA